MLGGPVLVVAAIPAAPVVGIVVLGVLVTLGGHAVRSRALLVLGIALLMGGTAAIIVNGFVAYHQSPRDPRPCAVPPAC